MKQAMIIFSIIFASLLISACSSKPVPSGQYDALAKCMTANNVTMYGTTWCSHCQNQKKAFGDSFQYINFVDCDQHKDDCIKADVEGYPTWKINETNYAGEQNMYDLAKNSGCLDKLQ